MEFCDECSSMMRAEDGYWVCTNCGNRQKKDPDGEYVLSEKQEESDVIETGTGEDTGLPTTEIICPECGNDTAYWYMQQIRSADESETRFFVCTECDHRWREDDH
ncbi:MAG: transcription factor S [Halodesulfurarchaeum sp.]